MTTPPQPPLAAEKPIGQYLRPLRDLAAWALVGAPAVFLFAAVLDMLGSDFAAQTRYGFSGYVNLATIGFPIAAVVLALGVKPAHPQARLITLIALIEYAVASFFGVVFGLLFGVSGLAAQSAGTAFTALLTRSAWLAVLAVPAYGVLQIWLNLFTTPKPKQQPGVYGQTYGQPQQPYGYPNYQPGTVPPPGVVPPPGQTYGTPPPPMATQPFSAQPYGAYPPAQPPVWGSQPPQQPPMPPPAAETQVVPQSDSTTVLPPERPGFGPAEPDPPRQ